MLCSYAPFMRSTPVLALLLALPVSTLVAPGAAVAATHNRTAPCRLIGTRTASKYLGAKATAYPQTANDGTKLCLYVASTGRLEVEKGARSNWVSASAATSPPGTVIKSKPALGENGELVYNTRKKYRFALSGFERGTRYYSVYSQVIPPRKVFALAKIIHSKVAR